MSHNIAKEKTDASLQCKNLHYYNTINKSFIIWLRKLLHFDFIWISLLLEVPHRNVEYM